MFKIKKIDALEILDSRGEPTVEVIVYSKDKRARACVPSGASKGVYEAKEIRDGNKKRYHGKGVKRVIRNIKKVINSKLIGKEVTAQKKIDKILIALDGTKDKSRLGANALLGVSLAIARLGARLKKQFLYSYLQKIYGFKPRKRIPCPMFNLINGGKHGDSGLDIQEFLVIPQGIKNYKERLRAGSEIFSSLKLVLKKKGLSVGLGDEGGFVPHLKNNEDAFKLLLTAIKKAGYQPGKEIFLGLDVASSVFYKKGIYQLGEKSYSVLDLVSLYRRWIKKYPLISLEDPLSENDWMGWAFLEKEIKREKKNILTIGDDLFTTNPQRLKKGIELGIGGAILIKPNQIGTLTETIECIKLAQSNKYKIIISHRSGETVDTFIADLAVAVGADFIKAGAPSRGERLAKYNRLLEIEEGI